MSPSMVPFLYSKRTAAWPVDGRPGLALCLWTIENVLWLRFLYEPKTSRGTFRTDYPNRACGVKRRVVRACRAVIRSTNSSRFSFPNLLMSPSMTHAFSIVRTAYD